MPNMRPNPSQEQTVAPEHCASCLPNGSLGALRSSGSNGARSASPLRGDAPLAFRLRDGLENRQHNTHTHRPEAAQQIAQWTAKKTDIIAFVVGTGLASFAHVFAWRGKATFGSVCVFSWQASPKGFVAPAYTCLAAAWGRGRQKLASLGVGLAMRFAYLSSAGSAVRQLGCCCCRSIISIAVASLCLLTLFDGSICSCFPEGPAQM